jgi:hypothetical protein
MSEPEVWIDEFAINDPAESKAQIIMEDTPPCIECPLAARCKSEVIACKAFAAFVAHGDAAYHLPGFYARMTNPTRKVYTKLFPETEHDMHVSAA